MIQQQQLQGNQLELLQAIHDNDTELACKLIDDDSYTQNDTKDPPLIIEAIKQNNKDIFLKLLISPLYYKNGKLTDMNTILDQDGCSAIGHCAINGFQYGLQILLNDFSELIKQKQLDSRFVKYLKTDIDINYQLEDGSTLFHVGIFSDNPSILQILVNNGGDYNIPHEEGSPIHLSVKERCFKASKFLAQQKDLDFLIVDNYGSGIIHDCIFLDLQDIFELLMKNLNERYEQNEDGKNYVIEVMNLKNNIGNTPLLEAAQQPNTYYQEFLIQNSEKYLINLDEKNNLDETYKDMKKVYKKRKYMADSSEDSDSSTKENKQLQNQNNNTSKNNSKKNKKNQETNQLKQRNLEKQLEDTHTEQKSLDEKYKEYEEKFNELEKQKKQYQKDDNKFILIFISFLVIGWIILYFFTKNSIPKQQQDL